MCLVLCFILYLRPSECLSFTPLQLVPPQPIVVNNALRNVPEVATWAWEPGAHFGVHRIDEFWFDLPAQTAQVRE